MAKDSVISICGSLIINIFIVLVVCFTITTFLLYYLLHGNQPNEVNGVPQIATISTTGQYPPEMYIFTYELHLLSLITAILFILIYISHCKRIHTISQQQQHHHHHFTLAVNQTQQPPQPQLPSTMSIEESGESVTDLNTPSSTNGNSNSSGNRSIDIGSIRCCNRVCLALGLLSSLLMSIVGTVTLTVDVIAHSVLALLMFLSVIVHMLLLYIGVRRHIKEHISPISILLHRIAIFVCIPFNIIWIIVAVIVYSQCTTLTCSQYFYDSFPALEFITVIFVVVYIVSFSDEIAQTSIKFL